MTPQPTNRVNPQPYCRTSRRRPRHMGPQPAGRMNFQTFRCVNRRPAHRLNARPTQQINAQPAQTKSAPPFTRTSTQPTQQISLGLPHQVSPQPDNRVSARLSRRVGHTILEPAQSRRNRLPTTQPSRLTRIRLGSRIASELGERSRQLPTPNNNTPQPEPPTTTRSMASTPPKGRPGGSPPTCRRVFPSGPWGASSTDNQWTRYLPYLRAGAIISICSGVARSSCGRVCRPPTHRIR